MGYILFRNGKNAIGPFTSFNGAVDYMKERRLVGYMAVPLIAAEPSVVDQKVVAFGPNKSDASRPSKFPDAASAHRYLTAVASAFKWDSSTGRATNLNRFYDLLLGFEPDIYYYKIQLIKITRELSAMNGAGDPGLATAKRCVENFFGAKNGERK